MRQLCDAPRCAKWRAPRKSRYCHYHRRNAQAFGHPLANAIDKKLTAPYEKIAKRALRELKASDHPSLGMALKVMRMLLTQGPESQEQGKTLRRLNPSFLLRREILRLADGPDAVKPGEALAAVAGVWLLALRHPKLFPDDKRSVDYAMGRAVLKLRRLAVIESWWNDEEQRVENRQRPIPGLAAGLLGSLVRRHLGVFLQRLIEFIDCQHEQELQQKNTLAQPITVTTTTREEDKTCTRSRPIPAS